MQPKNKFLNEGGFTLVELVVAMGLSSIVVGAATYMLGDNQKFQALLGKKIERSADLTLGRSVIYRDLRLASPSFYFFKEKSKFFKFSDYGETAPTNCVTMTGSDAEFWYTTLQPACRGLEMILEEPGDSFYVAIENKKKGAGGQILSPEDVFSSDKIDKTKMKDWLKTKFGDELAKGTFKIRASTSMMIGEQMRSYGAIFSGDSLKLVNNGSLYDIPEDFCQTSKLAGGSITSLEAFLKCLPGNGIPRVNVVPINLVKYQVAEKDGNGSCQPIKYLHRTTTINGQDSAGLGILENLTTIRFYRDNTATTSIFLEVEFVPVENRRDCS